MLACTRKAWEKVQALRKDTIPPRGEPHPKSAMCSTRAPTAKHAFCAGVPKHTFRCNGRAEDRKRSSALTAFLAQSISFPHGRNILLLLGYPVKNVWAREGAGVAVGCYTNTSALCVDDTTLTLPHIPFLPSRIAKVLTLNPSLQESP